MLDFGDDPTGLSSPLATIIIIAALIGAIVINLRYLRNKRKRDDED
ncbi:MULTISPECIES: hypothetical protein [unclassified Crossiella]|nr:MULTISPECIES: hypothetical protein [unclassified Crossiella]MCK2240203.1 hypothetical protein [Crossiella sp. S99.2]MCK2253345.1 hypothetical protein [Crossiella sp. S99.1]